MEQDGRRRGAGAETAGHDYAARLQRLETIRWKRLLDVQRPYRWNLRRLNLGRVLDIGCGIGRNLVNLDGNGVGVDHNEVSVELARRRGLTAYTTQGFPDAPEAHRDGFDSLLIAHVMEHVDVDVADELVRQYLPYLRPGGKVVFVTPQEAGYRTDPTHVRFVDFAELGRQVERLGLEPRRSFSFPFPRRAGRFFPYNEFVVVAGKKLPTGGLGDGQGTRE